jgi:hypothetical protein
MSFTASAEVEPSELAELSEALILEDVLISLVAPARASSTGENLGDVIVDGDNTDGADADDAAITQQEADRLSALGRAA